MIIIIIILFYNPNIRRFGGTSNNVTMQITTNYNITSERSEKTHEKL